MNFPTRRLVSFLVLALLVSFEVGSVGHGLASGFAPPAADACADHGCCPGTTPQTGSSRCEHCDAAVPLVLGASPSRSYDLDRLAILWETDLPLAPFQDVPSPVPIAS
jgi:hypothetical protein